MESGPEHTTQFSHIYGALLGSGQVTPTAGGLSPDDAAFWDYLLLLRVERSRLSRLLQALPTPLGTAQHAQLRLVVTHIVSALQNCQTAVDRTRAGNACATLSVVLEHLLVARKLQYAAVEAALCESHESDQFFQSLLSRLHTILTTDSAGDSLQHAALQVLLVVATACRVTDNPIFARLLEARFQTSDGPAVDSDDTTLRANEAGAGGQLFVGVLAALTAECYEGSEAGEHGTCMQIQSSAALLMTLALHHQRGENQNSFVAGLSNLSPR